MSLKQRRYKHQKAKSTKRPSREEAEGQRISRKAMRLYRTKLKALLEPAHWGMFAAIEADSGDYFLGARMGEALTQAKTKYPNKLVYIVRIGFRAAAKAR